ncbi:hypothetical protein [Streptomyces silaceus]|uniref:hypothetical protein n=1 Tax=Streptomyces silaceus TaxID=545123 RepID=UPI001ABF9B9F|nr:hypothetical protein [Streptomyces silaceus]
MDDERRDPWVPSAGARELMVSVFYPARRGDGSGDRAPYLAAKEAAPRIRAAANLDGTFFAPVPSTGTGRPVLMLGTDKKHHPRADDTTWLREWRRLDGWKRWFTVADSGHFTFTDLPVLGGQLGMTDPSAPLSGTRSGQITNGYVTAFFDRHLLGRHRPLLDGPSKDDPEVTFHSP